MAETYTPNCDYDMKAHEFELLGVDDQIHTLESCQGEKATLIMFICNHCPYVQSIIDQLAVEVSVMQKKGLDALLLMLMTMMHIRMTHLKT